MDSIAVYVGLDYHQSGVQVCVVDAEGRVLLNRGSANDWRAIVAAAQRYGRVVRAAIESCTGAANLAEELVERAGWSVDLAHPGYVSRMKGSPDKTDFSDARMLADLERVGYLPKVWLAPEETRELRRLIRYRQQLSHQRRSTKLRIGALLREHRVGVGPAGRWSKSWIAWLQGLSLSEQARWIIDRHLIRLQELHVEVRAVEDRLAKVTEEDTVVDKLLTMPGIGPVTAWTLRAEIGRFERFGSGKQLSRFCGLSPRNASSGTRQADAGLVKAGNRQLRATLMDAAHRLIRYEVRWTLFACKLLSKGKPKSVIAAAVANRWIRWLFHQMQPATRAA
jgi:transposase